MAYLLIINFLIYFAYFVYILKSKLSGKYYSLLIVGLFTISSLLSIFYYDSDLYTTLTEATHKISWIALIYLFIGFLILTYPVNHYQQINSIVYPKIGKSNLITIIFIILGIISIIPFLENFMRAINMSGQNMADIYFDRRGLNVEVDSRSQLSSIGRICNGVVNWFQYFMPVGLFYFIQQKKKWYLVLLIALGALNPVLLSIITGGRGALFQSFCIFLFNYVLFYKSIDKKIRKIVTIAGLSVLSVLVIILVIMTFARAGGASDIALQGIYRYLGEGFVNFGETGWFVKRHTNGLSIFNGTGYTFLKDLSPYFEARDFEMLGSITGIRMYVYYTVMGDAFLDFNVLGGYIFLLVMASLFVWVTKGKNNYFSSIVLFNLYAKVCFNGIYCWAFMYALDYVLFTLIMVFILRMFESRR